LHRRRINAIRLHLIFQMLISFNNFNLFRSLFYTRKNISEFKMWIFDLWSEGIRGSEDLRICGRCHCMKTNYILNRVEQNKMILLTNKVFCWSFVHFNLNLFPIQKINNLAFSIRFWKLLTFLIFKFTFFKISIFKFPFSNFYLQISFINV
jgi:hypothetical protein